MAVKWGVGDVALTPGGDLVTVVYIGSDGRVAVESPWSAQWVRYEARLLRRPEGGS